MSPTVNIDDMSYNMLRKLAKQYGINGKQKVRPIRNFKFSALKAVTLRAALKDALKPVQLLDGGSEV